MKRWHEDYYVSKRQWKRDRQDHVDTNKNSMKYPGYDPDKVDCACDDQIGRFRKRHAFDCGNPKCGICHRDKFPKRELTEKEQSANISFIEQLKDL